MSFGARGKACWLGSQAALACMAFGLAGCATLQPQVDGFCERNATPIELLGDDSALYQSASADRATQFEREVARLHADLDQAEQQLVAIESGIRSTHTRADAVSAIADSRIAVGRAQRRAPWRTDDIAEARLKLEEAERQLQAGHSGSAVFFASRAGRVASDLNAEAAEVERHGETLFVDAPRVNLRSGPSTDHRVVVVLGAATPVFPQRFEGEWLLVRTVTGPVGWVHSTLVRRP